MKLKTIKVVAGILYNEDKILLASRPLDKSFPNYWEFPGGKIEIGENPKQALIRELKEEIGVNVDEADLSFLTQLSRSYDQDIIDLTVFRISKWQNKAIALESQCLYWHNISNKCDCTPLLPTTLDLLKLLKVPL